MNLANEIQENISDFPEWIQQLSNTIGMDNLLKIVKNFGGSTLCIPKSVNPHVLTRKQQDIKNLIGIEALNELSVVFGGSPVYVPLFTKLEHRLRNQKVIAQFDGKNYAELSKKFGCGERQIRRIVSKKNGKKAGR